MKTKGERVGSNITLIIIIISVFSIDRISKLFVNFYLNEKINIIPGFLWFTNVKNTGAAFGILKNNAIILGMLTLIFSLIILYLIFFKNYKNILKISLSLIAAGALGNSIDRLFLGYVIDFIDFGWWPVFNISDSFICIGTGIIIYYLLKKEIKNNKTNHRYI